MREYNYCLRCGRKLKSKENRYRGYGKTCYEKSKQVKRFPLFENTSDIKKMLNEATVDNNNLRDKYNQLKAENRELKKRLNGGI